MDEVVLVMAEGDLVAAEFLSEVEEQLAAVPGAEEAGLFLLAQPGGGSLIILITRNLDLEACSPDVEPDAERVAEGLEIAGVRLVADVLHPHVQGLDGEAGMLDE